MKRLTYTTLVLIVTAVTLTGCETASKFCLRNRGAACDPCAPPCTPSCEPGFDPYMTPGITYPSSVPLETTPLPGGDPMVMPGQ